MTVHTLIVGLGNTLRGDDALGRIAADRLRLMVAPGQVKVIDQVAPTPELAAELAAVERVVFLDASVDGPADHSIVRRLTRNDAGEALAHQASVGALLALSGRLYGHIPEAFAITFRGRTFDFQDCRLSPEVEAACRQIVTKTLQIVGTDRSPALEQQDSTA